MILRAAAADHSNAMLRFRPHIDESMQVSFDQAWEEYEGADKYSSGTQETAIAKRKLALERIEKLFKFAK